MHTEGAHEVRTITGISVPLANELENVLALYPATPHCIVRASSHLVLALPSVYAPHISVVLHLLDKGQKNYLYCFAWAVYATVWHLVVFIGTFHWRYCPMYTSVRRL